MVVKKINRYFLISSIIMLGIITFIQFYVYQNIKEPVFIQLVSARILGANERDFFIDLIWEVNNESITAYNIDITELNFHEFNETIARVYFNDMIKINPFTVSTFKVTATLNRDTFERLMSNYIESYSFNLTGTAKAKTLFFSKDLDIYKFIPINIISLINDFLYESFKNSIIVERITYSEQSGRLLVDCDISLYNRTGLEMIVSDFEGKLYLNNFEGTVIHFEPIRFVNNMPRRVSRIRFGIDNYPLEDSINNRYYIDGNITASLWEKEFIFPVEIIGEN